MKITKIILLALIATGFVACQEEYEPDMFPGHELAGEWYVEEYVNDTLEHGHALLMTYNVAAANGDIWVDDQDHFYGFKAKITGNPGAGTFAGTGDNTMAPWVTYDTLDVTAPYDSLEVIDSGFETITVEEGAIYTDGGSSKTGVVTDSIYIRVTFSDDPDGDVYEYKGHRRTGFLEDDY